MKEVEVMNTPHEMLGAAKSIFFTPPTCVKKLSIRIVGMVLMTAAALSGCIVNGDSSWDKTVSNLSPSDGMTLATNMPRFSWNAVPDAAGYQVQFSDNLDNLASSKSSEVSAASYMLSNALEDGKTYYWRVRAMSASRQAGPWCDTAVLKINTDTTLHAKSVPLRTVTFESNSGSAVTSQQVAQGDYVTEPVNPTKSSHAFDGWYSDSGLSNAWTFGSDTVNSDITLYAKWVLLRTVTFDSNSGSAVTSRQVAQGDYAPEPVDPTKSGHAFDGWYSDSSLSNAWTFGSDTVDSDITLYAKWLIIFHTVTFETNSGSAITSLQVAEGTYAAEPADPTRSGYVFRGWYSDSGLSTAWTFGSDTVDSNITLYARWVPLHTVTFESNSGSTVTSQQVPQGDYAPEPANPTRSGYVFRGWYSDSGLSTAWTFGSDTVDSNITLYARWVPLHTVTFESNSGSTVTSQQVPQGDYAPEPANPTRSGHVFRGWYSDSGLSNAWTFGSDTVNSDITLYARWVPLHTVTFESNSGSTVTSQQVPEGDYAPEPADPTRSGYGFGGWYSDSRLSNAWTFGSDTVDSDITLYARWMMLEAVFVQGGTFQMGSTDSEAKSNESPVHSVTLSSFYMGETEVTHRQYLKFLNDAGVYASGELMWNGSEVIDMDASDVAFSHNGAKFSFAASDKAKYIDCPVIMVTWYGAVEYSNWLSEQDGLTKAYSINGTSVTWNQSANGYRLPTEAEWEYAARGGAQSEGYKYAGSNNVHLAGWSWHNSQGETKQVQHMYANELDLYDMSGNVWEWCWDWYDKDYYSSSPASNPTGPSSGQYRAVRGGSWGDFSDSLRLTYRGGAGPGYGFNDIGFRLVRPAD